jgi:tRNA(Phe) wybutosine-synthesizing methylase Tyw3
MSRDVHEHITVWVKVHVDIGIASMVGRLNQMIGVYTSSSCQGTIGEGGAEPYGPFVAVYWEDETARHRIEAEYDLTIEGDSFGTARPRAQSSDEL